MTNDDSVGGFRRQEQKKTPEGGAVPASVVPAILYPDPFRLCELVGDDDLPSCGLQIRRVALA